MARHSHNQSAETANMDQTTEMEQTTETIAAPPPAVTTDEAAPSTTLKIADIDVTVPLKFLPGHVLTDTQARILDAAYQRQFINNQNALAKARAERLAKAGTDAERLANAPLSAEDSAALYADYEPNVGREARGSTLDRLRATAAWRVWTDTVVAHNKSVAMGGEPVIVRAGRAPVRLMTAPRRAKGTTDAQHEQAMADFESAKAALIAKLLATPVYAERIQTVLDAMAAEKAPAGAAEVTVAGADLI